MIKKPSTIFGILAMLVSPSLAQTNYVVYANANDGMLEKRSEWTTGAVVHNTDWWDGNLGEWYGSGLTVLVFPLELPNLGAVDDPFLSADFGVNFFDKGDATGTPIDLYGVRVDASSAISSNDWYTGQSADTNATLLQASFLTPTSTLGAVHTDGTGDANLLAYLNAAYDGGTNAGKFVFLRLSYHSDGYASGWDAYKVTMRNAAMESDWPVLNVTTVNLDTDGDGLPNNWELTYGLDPYDDGSTNINNGALGDPDLDTLVNSNEYALGTNPMVADTDDDGLTDAEEVNTYLTDPLDADSDDDSLKDGDEVNLYGSNPLSQHSDADGEPDGIEIIQGTDPTNTLSSSAALGLVIMDGTIDSYYGDAVATQTVNTAWGDNANELNAAYAYVQNGRLFLMTTGNIQDNWNKIEIFIDSTDAVTTNVLDAVGNDESDFMDGLTFDTGFTPDYHLSARRGAGQFFNLDIAALGTTNYTSHQNVFNNSMEGFALTSTGVVNALPIGIAYNNSNTNGVIDGEDAAIVSNVLAVTTGLELSIALSDLGNPETVRIMVFINGGKHDWVSNQILPGLAAPQAALGRDGMNGDGGGVYTNSLGGVDFNNFAGDQFFTLAMPSAVVPVEIMTGQLISANTLFELSLRKLVINADYKVQETTDLTAAFADVPGSDWKASSTNEVITVPADIGANPAMFYRVVSP